VPAPSGVGETRRGFSSPMEIDMSLDTIIKTKVPAFPKDIDDKNIEADYKKFEKAYAEIQAAAKEFYNVLGRTVNGTFGAVSVDCLTKLKDKNLDPKQKKALEDLRKTVQQLENYVGKIA
jgi:hypothetical protein